MVGVPALITETFSCSYPKHHRARTHKPEVNKHRSPAGSRSRAEKPEMRDTVHHLA